MEELEETELTTEAKVYIWKKQEPRRPSYFRRPPNKRGSTIGPTGAPGNYPQDEEKSFIDNFRTQNETVREILGELLGTFVLTLCGNAVGASTTLGRMTAAAPIVNPIGWGLTVAFCIYICGGVSGAHMNPAVTVAMATLGRLPWSKIFHFMLAQYLGAFLSAAVLYGLYIESFDVYDGGSRQTFPAENATSQIFSTFPLAHVSMVTCFGDQVLGTALLLLAIMAIGDERNMSIPKCLQPLATGFVLSMLIMGFSYNCGAALNPARDLGPRIFTAMAGYGVEVFSTRNYTWFWIPVVACHIGGVLGAWTYRLMVEIHWPPEEHKIMNHCWKPESVAAVSSSDMGYLAPSQTAKSRNGIPDENNAQEMR